MWSLTRWCTQTLVWPLPLQQKPCMQWCLERCLQFWSHEHVQKTLPHFLHWVTSHASKNAATWHSLTHFTRAQKMLPHFTRWLTLHVSFADSLHTSVIHWLTLHVSFAESLHTSVIHWLTLYVSFADSLYMCICWLTSHKCHSLTHFTCVICWLTLHVSCADSLHTSVIPWLTLHVSFADSLYMCHLLTHFTQVSFNDSHHTCPKDTATYVSKGPAFSFLNERLHRSMSCHNVPVGLACMELHRTTAFTNIVLQMQSSCIQCVWILCLCG